MGPMTATVQTKGVGAGFGDRGLFAGVDLVVAPGDVVGLVGPNGAGKSTLLQILAGRRRPDAGTVSVSPPTARLGYLAQEIERRDDESVRAHLERRTGVGPAQVALDTAAEALGAGAEGSDDLLSDALEGWLALGGADLETRLGTVVDDLGLTVDLDLPMTALSGGQAARVGLAALLLSRYDLYLLDEPTNDLDAAGLDLLEDFVGRSEAPIVVVSHDREFLSRTVTSVVEIDRSLQRVLSYGGSYDSYLEERSVARRRAREAYEGYASRLDALTARARTQRAWMEKGVKNARRKAPDNDKIGRKFRAEASEKQAAKARQTDRLISRLDVVEEPRKEWQLQLSIAAAPRSGAVVAVARQATVQRGDFRLGPVDLQLDWRDRVAVTGPNGAGKSTLLALLLGRLAATTGAADLGSGVLVGEVDQARRAFEGAARCRTGRRRTCAPCWPSSGSPVTTSLGRRRRSPRASGPAPRWRCSRRAGSTSWFSTSRPTTWT